MFLQSWHDAARTSLGLFWMAFWAFALGYFVSSMIQVFVSRERMRKAMGDSGAKSVGLGSFFGFVSSSCSFAAISTTRSLFSKGAGLVPALAFLLSSTNLVIELGIVIAVFLTWQFVVGEYLGGLLLILLMWLVVRATLPKRMVERARERARQREGNDEPDRAPDWKKLMRSREGWRRVAQRYVMEWKMVWKDVTLGLSVAGIIATFVPTRFFQTLFVGAGDPNPGFGEVVIQTIVGPVAAFFTFIGSMGNIPLAAVLFGNGVSFAGIMAFIFSDLVVFPVLRIQAKYYGWKMATYLLGVFVAILIGAALILHYGLSAANMLPDPHAARTVVERDFFAVDYTLFLNGAFALMSAVFLIWKAATSGIAANKSDDLGERILFWLAIVALLWLAGGLLAPI